MENCYISLGSNLHQPLLQLSLAQKSIADLAETTLSQSSSIYQSTALTLDDEPQDDYLNAVLLVKTHLNPEDLLDKLQAIEQAQGRVREKRWGARSIDLDILLYGDLQINSQRLTIPHIEMHKRNFVLFPLEQLSPDLVIPGNGALKTLLKNIDDSGLQKVGEFVNG